MSNPLDGLFDDLGDDQSVSHLVNLLDQIGPDIPSLVKLASTHLMELAKDREQGYGGAIVPGFHPSFLAGRRCPIAYYYSTGVVERKEDEFDPRTLRIFGNGNKVHSRIQAYLAPYLYGTWKCRTCHKFVNEHSDYVRWLQKANRRTDHISSHSHSPVGMPEECPYCGASNGEYTFKYAEWRVMTPTITGKIDGLVMNAKGNFVGIEIKSANDRMFGILRSNRGESLWKYKEQFGLYLKSLGLRFGMILVENKNDQELMEFPVDMQFPEISARIKEIESSIETALQYTNNNVPVPTKIAECNTCPFYKSPCQPGERRKT